MQTFSYNYDWPPECKTILIIPNMQIYVWNHLQCWLKCFINSLKNFNMVMIWCLLKYIHRRYFSSLKLSNMKNDQEAFNIVCNSFLQFTAFKVKSWKLIFTLYSMHASRKSFGRLDVHLCNISPLFAYIGNSALMDTAMFFIH